MNKQAETNGGPAAQGTISTAAPETAVPGGEFAGATPGPWAPGMRHPGRVIAVNGRHNVIAYCTPHPDDDDSPTEEEATNARLIAAAPALLAERDAAQAELRQRTQERDQARRAIETVLAGHASVPLPGFETDEAILRAALGAERPA